MNKILLLFFIVFQSLWSFGQLENIPLITVTGEAIVFAKPDHVILGFKVCKSMDINTNGTPTGFEIFKTEDTKIRLFDFDEQNIDVGTIRIDSNIYVKEIHLEIFDILKLDRVILELYRLGYKEFHYIDYRLQDFNSYKNQANKEAIKSAHEKASALAKELGQSIGKAHLIDEISFQNYNWYTLNMDSVDKVSLRADSDKYLIKPGYITLTSKIKVSFDLIK